MSESASGKRRAAILGVIVGIALFSALMVPSLFMEFDMVDDVLFLYRAHSQSLLEMFTTSWLADTHSAFYRPLSTLLTKVLLTPSLSILPYRAVQLILSALSIVAIVAYLRRQGSGRAGIAAAVILFSVSPFLSNALTWWSDVTSLLNILFFSCALLLIASRKRVHWLPAALLTIGALLSKELGLVVASLFGWEFLRQRRFNPLVSIVLIVMGYFAVRFFALDDPLPYGDKLAFQSGVLVFSKEQTREFLGNFTLPYYLYNAAAQIVAVFFWQPVSGMLRFEPLRNLLATLLFTGSSLLIFWAWRIKRISVPSAFAIVLIANALVSYRYANERHLVLSAIVWIILFAKAIDAAWDHSRNASRFPLSAIVVVLLAGWTAFSGLFLSHLYHAILTRGKAFERQEQFGHPELAPAGEIYDIIRARHVQ